ncbi:hypothetical protein [Eudoraea chungangensis]|uniref:hypothetical protein n=1 Tax=Eudoraea chungangensis TaxID=1481905 RepID=UPI0023EB3EF9|nr:hypothetical protein [Eudoraea chungangensis]
MIKFFRKIRQDLLSKGKTIKYFKYAIGEIFLVVIGILIALWLNNLNQVSNKNQERQKLKISLIKELRENRNSFSNYKNYVNECNKKNIIILNISAGKQTDLPIDSIRKYVVNMFPIRTLGFNESVRKSTNSAGKLDLLTMKEGKAIADYESSVENYKEARKINTIWKESNRQMFSYLSVFEQRINQNLEIRLPNMTLVNHSDYDLSDKEFIDYLQNIETYTKLKDIFISTTVDITWLESIIEDIDKTIEVLQ